MRITKVGKSTEGFQKKPFIGPSFISYEHKIDELKYSQILLHTSMESSPATKEQTIFRNKIKAIGYHSRH